MSAFKQVDFTITFSLSTTSNAKIDEHIHLIDREVFDALLKFTQENNVAITRPKTDARSTE